MTEPTAKAPLATGWSATEAATTAHDLETEFYADLTAAAPGDVDGRPLDSGPRWERWDEVPLWLPPSPTGRASTVHVPNPVLAQPSAMRRAFAPVVLLSALAAGALGHGAVADRVAPAAPSISTQESASNGPFSLQGAWRRLPLQSAEPPATPAILDPAPPAVQVDIEGGVDDPLYVPMALDAICALPLIETAARIPEPQTSLDPVAVRPSLPADADPSAASPVVTIDWPMLEPWSPSMDEIAAASSIRRGNGLRKAARLGARAAVAPGPEPDPAPVKGAKVKPASTVAQQPKPAPTERYDFMITARDAP